MKHMLFVLLICIISTGIGAAQNEGGFPLHVGKQKIVMPTDLKSAQEGEKVFIVAGRNEPSSGKVTKSYGFQMNGKGKNSLTQPLIELIDASTKKVVRKISFGEFLGKESDGWKSLAKESSSSADKIVSAFAFTAGGQHFKFYREIQSVSDDHFPDGKGSTMAFSITGEKPAEMSMRFLGACDGAFGQEKKACFLGDSANEQASRLMIVMLANPAASITNDGKKRKGEPNRFVIESAPVSLAPGAKAVLLTLTISGTTVGEPVHAAKQAQNLIAYFNGQVPKPELVALTHVDRQNTKSGDTVTYSIDYHNIGAAAGKDVEINNPVPPGTNYLENSAGGDAGAVSVTRSGQDNTPSIQWKSAEPIMPGSHRSVRFRVIIQ